MEQIDPYATIVKEAQPIRVEMVVRGYLTGSMWRGYEKGERSFSGVVVPDGMTRHQAFAQPILTPTTKDKDDTAIDERGILERGLVSAAIYQQMKAKALELFAFGSQFLAERGIILVDTKYEFGLLDGQLILIDEIHTPDSSRFWNAAAYAKDPATVEQIDKEFVRQWMLQNKIDGDVPSVLSEAVIAETMRRYQDIYQTVVGQPLNVPNVPHTVRLYHSLVDRGLIKAGLVSIIVEDLEAIEEHVDFIESALVAFDIATERRFLASYHNSEQLVEWAAQYNTSIEPVVVITLPLPHSNLAAMAMTNFAVPVINFLGEGVEEGSFDASVVTPTVSLSTDHVALAALRSLNIPAIRVELDRQVQEAKQSLKDLDDKLRKREPLEGDLSEVFDDAEEFEDPF